MSSESKIIIKREALYEQVWRTPASVLAKEYRISDSMLSRICKKLHVPKPPVGYWTRLKHAKRIQRPPLPPIGPEEPTQYEHYELPYTRAIQVDDPDFLSLMSRVPSPLPVSKSLQNPDPLIRNTQTYYESIGKRGDEASSLEHLSLSVYPNSLNRALRILDSIIKCLNKLGCDVRGSCGFGTEQYIEILGERIVFRIREQTKRVDHVLTKEELATKTEGRYFHADKWDYVPLGHLILFMDVWADGINQKRWSDSPQRPLEAKLGEFVIGVISAAGILKKQRVEREQAERLAAEQRRLKLEEEKKQAEEESRRKAVDNHVANWIRSKQLKAFVQELELRLMSGPYAEQAKKEFEAWIIWAREYASQLDPITATLAKMSGSSLKDR